MANKSVQFSALNHFSQRVFNAIAARTCKIVFQITDTEFYDNLHCLAVNYSLRKETGRVRLLKHLKTELIEKSHLQHSHI